MKAHIVMWTDSSGHLQAFIVAHFLPFNKDHDFFPVPDARICHSILPATAGRAASLSWEEAANTACSAGIHKPRPSERSPSFAQGDPLLVCLIRNIRSFTEALRGFAENFGTFLHIPQLTVTFC